jgi:hypothetical protein
MESVGNVRKSIMRKEKMIEEIIRINMDSMETHLVGCYEPKSELGKDETNNFHKQCVRDYARAIYLASKLYEL